MEGGGWWARQDSDDDIVNESQEALADLPDGSGSEFDSDGEHHICSFHLNSFQADMHACFA